ncbi:MAG: hydantoinase B/oxoprolinase family protein [Arenicellales bacterium]
MSAIRLAVDIGGTFTDAMLQINGGNLSAKIPTTPAAPHQAFMDIAVSLLERAGINASSVSSIIHGTTIATNALIERKGARTALVTTKGFRDSLEIGYESRHDQYDLGLEKLPPLVPRHLRLPIDERTLCHGEVHTPLNESEFPALAQILREQNVESVAVGFLHAHVNPGHERLARQLLSQELPDIPVSLSSEVCPEIREYERFSTTVADAYIKPLIRRYLTTLLERLREVGFRCPLFMVTSSGGLMEIESAMQRPIHLVESGPSGGATLAENTARQCQHTRVLSFDMGGTTAKICLIDDYRARTTREFEAARAARFIKGSGFPLRMPVTEMIEIGAGGGSIGSMDAMGRIQIGPHSAGAEPGPACYGRGGDQATITDADAELGRLDPVGFARGRIQLDLAASANVLQSRFVPDHFNDKCSAARAMVQMVDENMANAARIHAMEHASDLSSYTMVAFGGAGPLHAVNLAKKLGVKKIVVPVLPGVGSALGFLAMPASCELSHSRYMTLGCFDYQGMTNILTDLETQARNIVSLAMPEATVTVSRTALMRYSGQGHEIEIDIPDSTEQNTVVKGLGVAYACAYRSLYGRELPGGEVEVMTFTVRVCSERPAVPGLKQGQFETASGIATEITDTRTVIDPESGESMATPVYARDSLQPGVELTGPALIVEAQTTTVLPHGYRLHVDRDGNLVLEELSTHADSLDGQKYLDDLQVQAMWSRLQAIVDEQAAVLMRTAFSPIVRESGDLSVGIFDPQGRMLAQAVTGTPGHVNTMASACKKFFEIFPLDEMRQGDIYVTNDPWSGAGHLNDFVLLKPCFYRSRLVALISCTSHLVDIGGRCLGPDGTDVYDEGLYIPHLKLVDQQQLNQTLVALVKSNSRSAAQAEGDVFALIACCEHGDHRLQQMLNDFNCHDIQIVADRILESSESAVRQRIAALQDTTSGYEMTVDGFEHPITIKARMRIDWDTLHLDFYESALPSKSGINVPLNYTIAYSVFGLKCAIAPDVPNNHGSLAPFKVTAATGTILNAQKPSPVCSRHILGQLLPDVSLGCLSKVLSEIIPAEGAATLWDLPIQGLIETTGETFAQELVFNGGMGARPNRDGLSATAFPSGVMGSLVEVTESTTPVLVRRRELRPDSGGPGKFRGGLGQIIEVEALADTMLTVYGTVDRVQFPARGKAGGEAGATGRFIHSSGTEFKGKGSCLLKAGERLTVFTPGGGGYGPVAERSAQRRQTDILNQLVTTSD